MADLVQSVEAVFLKAQRTLEGSLLYLDSGAAEAIHVNLGLKFLQGEFSPAERGSLGSRLSRQRALH